MGHVALRGRVDVPAQALWERIADFGNVDWVPGIRQLEVRGSGPGMQRIVAMGEGSPACERLDRIDAATRSIEYRVSGGERTSELERARAGEAPPAFPVRAYRARMCVEPMASGCELCWSCEFEPDAVAEEDALEAMAQLGALLFRWLKRAVESVE
jgi:hypothetical protein